MKVLLKITKIYVYFFYAYQFLFFFKKLEYNYFGYFFFKYNIFFRFPNSFFFDNFYFFFKNFKIFGFLFKNKQYLSRLKNLKFLTINFSLKNYFSLLEIVGRNYRFIIKNNFLIIFLGFCHYFYIQIPKEMGINLLNDNGTELILWSFSKDLIIRFCFLLKKLYKKDIYKGKGLLFDNIKYELKRKKKKEFL